MDLGEIFEVIFKFEGLTKLGLGGLEMESLPERFGELKLTELNMAMGSMMGSYNSLNHEEALEIIIKIDTLTSLNLTRWKMSSLPEGFGQLKSLTSLNLSGDYYNPSKLKSLPEGN